MPERLYVVGDTETFYDSKNKYSLRSKGMDNASYLLDPRFERIGTAFKINGQKTGWIDGPEVSNFLTSLGDPSRIIFIAHNLLFDACELAWHTGWIAGFYVDTLALSRALLGHVLLRHDLDSVSRYLGVGAKGDTVHKVDGMTRQMIIDAGFYEEYAAYSCLDADLCWGIFQHLAPVMPPDELAINDIVHRMAIQPVLRTDPSTLHEHLAQVIARKEWLLARAGLQDRQTLMSDMKFAEALLALGVTPPEKISPTSGQKAWAFAKTDQGMKDLLEHDDLDVQALVAARLGVKSTIEESRTQRFINIGRLTFPGNKTNVLPVPLKSSGAHTHRLCLTGDTLITCLHDNRIVRKRLDQLTFEDLVWDGEAFVRHGGLAYAGCKEVITYDGITGTPDHRVWTLQFGYRSLAEAKAQSLDIACGNVPDATRVDTTVQWLNTVQNLDQVQLREVRSRMPVYVEGSLAQRQGLVQVVCNKRPHERQTAFSKNASGCGEKQSRGSKEATFAASGAAFAGITFDDPRNGSFTGKAPIQEMADKYLEGNYARRPTGVSALHQFQCEQLRVLRRSGDIVRLHIDASDGRLDLAKARTSAERNYVRSYQSKRSLRTRQPQVGDVARADGQSKFVATWDIVDCGPRNCFVANGRVVHNSGDWKLNLQNLTRANPVQKKRAMLRESIFAEEGYSMVVADESQIELRGTAKFCGQEDLLEACRDPNRDPYCEDATASRGYVVTKKDIGPRFCSKTKMLSCQYQVGWRKYRASVKHQSLEYIGMEIALTEQEAFNDVHLYRTRNYKIEGMWNYLNYQVIPLMTDPRCDFMLGPVRVMFEQIVLPNGMVVHYHKLHKNPMTGDWQYVYGREIKKIYGGKFLENIIQALCRIIVMDVTLRVKKPFAKLFQSRLAMQSHDELMYVCHNQYAEELKGVLVEEMRKPPVWWPDIPLDVDCHIGNCYGEVK